MPTGMGSVICWPPASAPSPTPGCGGSFVTYAFVHDPDHFSHILFNMLVLWFLGRDVEECTAAAEFVRLYLVLAVVGGVAWAAVNLFLAAPAARAVDFGPHRPEGDRRLGGGDRDRDPLRPEFSPPHAPLHVRAAHAGLGLGRDGRALRHLRGHACARATWPPPFTSPGPPSPCSTSSSDGTSARCCRDASPGPGSAPAAACGSIATSKTTGRPSASCAKRK